MKINCLIFIQLLRDRPISKRGKLWLVVSVSIAINLCFLLFYYTPSPKQLIGDETYYYQYALLLASGQRVPYNLLWPPLYGECIGYIFSLFGPRVIYVQIIQIGLWLASAFIFSGIVVKLTSSTEVKDISFILYISSPELIAFSHYLWPETVHLFLWLSSLWFLICRPFAWINTAIAGMLLGFALLTKSLLGPFVPVILIFLFLLGPKINQKTRFINVSLFAIMTIVITFPMMINNLIEREVFLIADSSVFNIWVGLNDFETMDSVNDIAGLEMEQYLQSGANLKIRNDILLDRIVQRINKQGLFSTLLNQFNKQYFRLFDVQTYFTTQLVGNHRQAYSLDSKIINITLELYAYIEYGFILIVGILGLCFLCGWPWNWSHLFALFIIYNLDIFLFLHVKTRYIIQFFPMLIFFASISVYRAVSNKKSLQNIPDFTFNRARINIGIVIGIIIGYISFYNLIFKAL